MPTPKNKRIVVLQSSYSATNVIANLNLTMNANFTTPGNVTTVNLLEDSSGTGTEATEYQMSFSIAGAAGSVAIGAITLSFTGEGAELASGVSVAKTSASTTTVPRGSSGRVTPIATPDAYQERVWSQTALNGTDELVDQVAGIDMRVKAESGYTVTQTVTSWDEDELVVAYEWKNAAGTSFASGTVRLEAASTAQGSYTLGSVVVVDDPPQGASRLAGETRSALRERIRGVTREIRRLRREARGG
ncbi:hypothetical protein [Nannocystis sp.]|uniref:hypothetical protein n=1 Tax=Nannocystis sp. TaxID=1962667 RepID=UPI0025EC8217|nr:hypothetical protein [Nannocystis sp.]MBK7826716.1 hypothetical protein [Nannocystis sp.]